MGELRWDISRLHR